MASRNDPVIIETLCSTSLIGLAEVKKKKKKYTTTWNFCQTFMFSSFGYELVFRRPFEAGLSPGELWIFQSFNFPLRP